MINWLPISTLHLYNGSAPLLVWSEAAAHGANVAGPFLILEPGQLRNRVENGNLHQYTHWSPLRRPRVS